MKNAIKDVMCEKDILVKKLNDLNYSIFNKGEKENLKEIKNDEELRNLMSILYMVLIA